mgnify:CR=1 FL=1
MEKYFWYIAALGLGFIFADVFGRLVYVIAKGIKERFFTEDDIFNDKLERGK